MEMFQQKFFIDENGDFTFADVLVTGKLEELESYKKAYFTNAYNREKYMGVFAKLKQLAIKYRKSSIVKRVSPYKVYKLCLIKEQGIIKSMGDEKHIFRYKTLQTLYTKIYNYMPTSIDRENSYLIGDIICYPDTKQAEIAGTWHLPIKIRVQKHIALLKKLRADQHKPASL